MQASHAGFYLQCHIVGALRQLENTVRNNVRICNGVVLPRCNYDKFCSAPFCSLV